MKKEKSKLSDHLHVRLSRWEMNRIKGLAGLYAFGNVSLWVIYAALNAPRKHLEVDELHESTRKKIKRPSGRR
jgi:hypothetical protein